MKVYVDKDSCIRAVGTTTDTSLTELTINDETNPFKDWSTAKICCYKVSVLDGIVTGYTPYISSSLLEIVDRFGKILDKNDSGLDEIVNGLMETCETTMEHDSQITDCRLAIEEIYEMLLGGDTDGDR